MLAHNHHHHHHHCVWKNRLKYVALYWQGNDKLQWLIDAVCNFNLFKLVFHTGETWIIN